MSSFHVAFDAPVLLKKRIYYFKYNNVLFKLISANKEWQHCLVSIPENYDKDWPNILNSGLEFLSVLSWEWGLPVIFSGTAGYGSGHDIKKTKRGSDQSRLPSRKTMDSS